MPKSSSGSQPKTEAEWDAFMRGDWPPKKTAAKAAVKRAPKRETPTQKKTEAAVKATAPPPPNVASTAADSAPPAKAELNAALRPPAVIDEPPPDPGGRLKGSETPRIYTPPRRELTPETSDGWAAITFAKDMLGLNLFPWQKWLLIHALELNEDLTYRFRTVIMEQARQNGKTMMMIVLALWHVYCKGSRTVIATAQDLSKAEDAWAAALEMAQDDEELNELIRKISLAHPKLLKVLNPITNKLCSYRVASKSRGGGRGFSGDLVLLDELREHQSWDSWAAVTKTQMARPRAQAWAFTNAGDGMSVVWRYQRALAHRNLGWPDGDADALVLGEVEVGVAELMLQLEKEIGVDMSTGWFEWSAPPNAKRTDRQAWAQANGSMNHTDVVVDCVTERAIAHALHTDPVAVFDQEVMCRYVPFADGGPFPEGAWRDTVDDDATVAPDARSAMCVEVSTTRSAAVIAKAALDITGNPVVGIVEMRAGTDWVQKWLIDNRSSYSGIVVRASAGSPVLSLMQDLVEAKLPVIEWKSADVGIAFGQIFDQVVQRKVRHLSHPGLDAAACSAAVKLQSAGGFIVDPVHSPSDVAPLYGATGAVWGIAQLPFDGPSIYSGTNGLEVLAF